MKEKETEQLKEKLIKREQYYIDNLKPNYNILPTAYSLLGHEFTKEHKKKIGQALKGKYTGKDHWWWGKEHTEQWKNKMSKKLSGANNPMYGKNGKENPMYGRNHSIKSKRKNSRNNGKLLEIEVLQIRKLCKEENYSQREIADMYNVSKTTISEINTRKRWKYI